MIGEDEGSYVLIESPRWGDAEFFGKWLLAAAKANDLWRKARNDLNLYRQVERLEVIYTVDISLCALNLLGELRVQLTTVMFPVGDEYLGEQFALMAEMQFFVLTDRRYQMVVPNQLSMASVKTALLRLSSTEDEEYYLHPERLVRTMPFVEAETWQRRLSAMDENHRCADRRLLLEGDADVPLKFSV